MGLTGLLAGQTNGLDFHPLWTLLRAERLDGGPSPFQMGLQWKMLGGHRTAGACGRGARRSRWGEA